MAIECGRSSAARRRRTGIPRSTYDFPFAVTDAKILALDYYELGACMQTNTPPEVTGEVGRRATALVYAIVESRRLGRPVTLDEVERVEVDGYQRAIDQHLGLI
jgi:hypothetical protein